MTIMLTVSVGVVTLVARLIAGMDLQFSIARMATASTNPPALAQAQIGIALGSGRDVAAAAAHIVLVNSNPADITALIRFGRATYRKMLQNLI